jgi:hypothetical protein
MPDGTVIWYDERTREARIEHLGREFVAHSNEIEPDARVTGSRVHFDIARHDGGEHAVNVVLVPGTRTSVHRHRRGEVTQVVVDEAGQPAMSGRRPHRHAHLERAPAHEIAEVWARHLKAGELDDAASLYAPDARIHVGASTVTGREVARRVLVRSPLFDGADIDVHVEDEGAAAVVGWAASEHGAAGMTRLRTRHGEIAEQWLPEVTAIPEAPRYPREGS